LEEADVRYDELLLAYRDVEDLVVAIDIAGTSDSGTPCLDRGTDETFILFAYDLAGEGTCLSVAKCGENTK
jgi:hypothetical protein